MASFAKRMLPLSHEVRTDGDVDGSRQITTVELTAEIGGGTLTVICEGPTEERAGWGAYLLLIEESHRPIGERRVTVRAVARHFGGVPLVIERGAVPMMAAR